MVKSVGKASFGSGSVVGRTEYLPFLEDRAFGSFFGEPGSVKTATVYEEFSRRYRHTPRIEDALTERVWCVAPTVPNPMLASTQPAQVVSE